MSEDVVVGRKAGPDGLEAVLEIARANAEDVDRRARFPRETVDALADAGLLGLTVGVEFGGRGQGQVAACEVVSGLARHCASSGMIFTMHLAGVAVLQASNDGRFDDVLRSIAAGTHVTTLALSERATRSNFWIATGYAERLADGGTRLDLEKSFVTSAGPATSYVVSAASPGRESVDESDLFLVGADVRGVQVLDWWQGSGLRGNASAPMRFACTLPPQAQIGAPGSGRHILLTQVIPWFQLGAASVSAGIAHAAGEVTREHVVTTRLEHLGQRLADQPVVRHGLGQLIAEVDALHGFVTATARALEEGKADLTHVLELKVMANEVALSATDRAMRLGGGAAYSGKSPAERLFRDARAGMVMAPTPDALYEMIGRVAVGLPAF